MSRARPSLENPFARDQPREDDDPTLVEAILGSDAAEIARRALEDQSSAPEAGAEDIVTRDELVAVEQREREQTPLITARVGEGDDVISTIPLEEGQEVTIDLREVFSFSLKFLTEKAPQSWAAALREAFPDGLIVTEEQRTTVERAISHGFTRVLLLPGSDVQGITTVETPVVGAARTTPAAVYRSPKFPDLLARTTAHLRETCMVAPVPDIPVDSRDQYGSVEYTQDEVTTGVSILRSGAPPRSRSYLLLYGPGSIPTATQGPSSHVLVEECIGVCAEAWDLPGCTGMTMHEAELLQRRETEERARIPETERRNRYGDDRIHAFDAHDVGYPANISRCIDSEVDNQCYYAYWEGWQGESIRGCDRRDDESAFGARIVVILEL